MKRKVFWPLYIVLIMRDEKESCLTSSSYHEWWIGKLFDPYSSYHEGWKGKLFDHYSSYYEGWKGKLFDPSSYHEGWKVLKTFWHTLSKNRNWSGLLKFPQARWRTQKWNFLVDLLCTFSIEMEENFKHKVCWYIFCIRMEETKKNLKKIRNTHTILWNQNQDGRRTQK